MLEYKYLIPVIIGLLVLFIAAEITGYILKVHSDKFYVVFHFAGGGLTYLLFLNLIHNRFLSLALVFAAGILWEIHEWILWKFFLKKVLYRPRMNDTKNDLLMDILGALSLYVIEII